MSDNELLDLPFRLYVKQRYSPYVSESELEKFLTALRAKGMETWGDLTRFHPGQHEVPIGLAAYLLHMYQVMSRSTLHGCMKPKECNERAVVEKTVQLWNSDSVPGKMKYWIHPNITDYSDHIKEAMKEIAHAVNQKIVFEEVDPRVYKPKTMNCGLPVDCAMFRKYFQGEEVSAGGCMGDFTIGKVEAEYRVTEDNKKATLWGQCRLNTVGLDSGCLGRDKGPWWRHRIVGHEILHGIGFRHEFAHPYARANSVVLKTLTFDSMTESQAGRVREECLGKYDAGSLTHYSMPRPGQLEFSDKAIQYLEKREKDLSKKVGRVCMPSTHDAKQILRLYFPEEFRKGVKITIPAEGLVAGPWLGKVRQNKELLFYIKKEPDGGPYDQTGTGYDGDPFVKHPNPKGKFQDYKYVLVDKE